MQPVILLKELSGVMKNACALSSQPVISRPMTWLADDYY
jgi:hypothetical protein